MSSPDDRLTDAELRDWADQSTDRADHAAEGVAIQAARELIELRAWKANAEITLAEDKRYIDEANSGELVKRLGDEVDELRATLAAIKAADPDLFDPRGGTNRGAAHENYGSPGHALREAYCAAIGINLNDYTGDDE
jgi:hypothetical protein